MFRPIMPTGGQHKGTSTCTAQGCIKSTREGKPFCSGHIECAPYVQKILGELRSRKVEESKLDKKRGRIAKDGFFYRETLLLLRSRDFTAKGLARRLDISHHASKRLIAMMAADRLVIHSITLRGDMTISGLGAQDLAEIKEQ